MIVAATYMSLEDFWAYIAGVEAGYKLVCKLAGRSWL